MRKSFYKTKQLDDEDTMKSLFENIVKKCQECPSEDLVNTYSKGLPELYNQVAQ